MSELLRVGVIGAGNMGRHHIRNYYEMPETELVAVADPSDTASQLADEYEAKRYESYEDMLDASNLDAVSIAAPTHFHYPMAKETITRGIHTLLEKPITSHPEEAEELINLSETNNVILTVGHVERFNPVVEALKEKVASGSLGKISSVIVQRLGGLPRNEPETDVIVDLAIHDIDIIGHILGVQGELIGVHGTSTFHSTETDSAEILMKFNGASGFIQANWVTPVKIRKISITGDRGYLEANYVTQEITQYKRMVIQSQPNFDTFVDRLGEPDTMSIKLEGREPLRRELGAFALAAAGYTSELIVNPREAVSALKIALDASKRVKEILDDSKQQ